MKIPIYNYKDKCLRCKKEIDIYYPEEIAFHHGIGNVLETNTTTQDEYILRNICPYCNGYQDHWFVRNHVLIASQDLNFCSACIWVDEDLICKECGVSLDYEIKQDQPLEIIHFLKDHGVLGVFLV